MAEISNDLKVELVQVFTVGFLDAMAGRPVEEEDAIPSDLAPPLADLAHACIAYSEQEIAAVYNENPSDVYRAVYDSGVQVAATINQAVGPAPIYLN